MTKIYIRGPKSLRHEVVIDAINKELSEAKDGVIVTVSRHKTKRSNAQNAYYWLVCTDVAKFLSDAGMCFKKLEYGGKTFEIYWSGEEVHSINKLVFQEKTTTKMTRKDFGEYMEKVFALWIEKTNGQWIVPIPMDNYFEQSGIMEEER